MGQKGKQQQVLAGAETRSHSMPNSLDGQRDADDGTEHEAKRLVEADTPPTPSTAHEQLWFHTWPERGEKTTEQTTPPIGHALPSRRNGHTPSQLTLHEALQNISLAYSPITRQLHLLADDTHALNVNNNDERVDGEEEEKQRICVEEGRRWGHRRNEAGSYSSTLSSLSNPSPSGSLLGAEERGGGSPSSEIDDRGKAAWLANYFQRGVFSWTSSSIFKKPLSHHGSPQHHPIIASSSALIQNIRPSNLPAKTIEEEQRHRDEYRAMVSAARKKEAQTTARRQRQHKIQLQQEEQLACAAKYFAQTVIPNWEQMCNAKKTKDLWWQGLPSSVRGRIWRLALGNELNLTQQLYEICAQRAQARLNGADACSDTSDLDPESSMEVIQLDIARTFPHLGIFQEGGPFSDVLHSLLAAYVCYRPDVGYVQGMSYIAAILILNLEELDAFVCFANLLNRPLHLAAFTLNQSTMSAYYTAYNELFHHNLPRLCAHFAKAGLTPDLYLLDWLYTIFAKAMPLDVACRVWDLFLRDGDVFIFRTALGVLHLHQDMLMGMDFLHGAQFLTRLPDDLCADQLFRSIQLMSTSIGKRTFNQLVDKHKMIA